MTINVMCDVSWMWAFLTKKSFKIYITFQLPSNTKLIDRIGLEDDKLRL